MIIGKKPDKTIRTSGFTLVEILVVLGIITVIAAAIYGLQSILSETQLTVWKNYLSVDEANINVTTMTRELRNLRTADNGSYPLLVAQDQEIIFYSDIDDDSQTERVRYTLSGTQLVKGVIEPQGSPVTYPTASEKVKVVADYVRNSSAPIFFYYNGYWPEDTVNNPLDTPTRLSDTKLMNVYLVINPDEDAPERNFILNSYAQLRNLKKNLGDIGFFNDPQPPGSTTTTCEPPSSGSPATDCGSYNGANCCRYQCSGGYPHWCERNSGSFGDCNNYLDCGIE
jgi:prepilin-type N-terminal cleavage/methylation domain-containing protein